MRNVKINPVATKKKIHTAKRKGNLPMDRPKSIKLYKKLGKIEPMFKGQTVYIVGGGPSLKDFDFKRLKGKNVIAINKAFSVVDFADILYWSDYRFYRDFQKKIHAFKGLKVTNKSKPIAHDIINLLDSGREGLDLNPNAVKNGNNSGYAALNLAVHTRAKIIVLLGYDMRMENRKSHWHEGYSLKINPRIYINNMIPCFKTIKFPIEELGIKIFNASPDSALQYFNKCTIEQAMNL